ncbi:hypothetical protein MAR_037220 [Mya arenaria]|uniref:Uncharacterized protein n=1 Tax=Mya arenaria TaxID=6604 RepID=A0ABY7FRN4_MYAAR|nr:hypothetical protein MAR_037220 [Mya arenaria]
MKALGFGWEKESQHQRFIPHGTTGSRTIQTAMKIVGFSEKRLIGMTTCAINLECSYNGNHRLIR